MERLYDAVILGAGVAGSAMAHALAGRGWRTLVVERGGTPRHKVCGEFLSPESRSSLNALGLDEIVGRLPACPIEAVRIVAASGRQLRFGLTEPALGVSRPELDGALLRSARERGAELLDETTALSVAPEGGRLRIEARGRRDAGERTLYARAVIGAWGRRAPAGLAGQAGARPRQAGGERVGWKVHLEGVRTEPEVELYFFAGGYVGIAPVGEQTANVAALVDAAFLREAGADPREWLRLAAARSPAFGRRIAGSRAVAGTGKAVAPVRIGRGPRAWEGRVALIGDAAMVVPPLCGDGMAMALRSAELCAPLADEYLRGRSSLEQWGRAYEEALRKPFAGPARWGRLLQTALGRPALASLLVGLGGAAPELARRAFRATRLPPPPSPR